MTLKNGLKETRKLDTGTDDPAISLLDTDPREVHMCTRRKPLGRCAGTLTAALVTAPTGNHPNAHQQVNGLITGYILAMAYATAMRMNELHAMAWMLSQILHQRKKEITQKSRKCMIRLTKTENKI